MYQVQYGEALREETQLDKHSHSNGVRLVEKQNTRIFEECCLHSPEKKGGGGEGRNSSVQELEIYHSVSMSTDCFYPKSADQKEPPQNRVQCHISASTIPCLPFFCWKMEERDAQEPLKKKGLATARAVLTKLRPFCLEKKKKREEELKSPWRPRWEGESGSGYK